MLKHQSLYPRPEGRGFTDCTDKSYKQGLFNENPLEDAKSINEIIKILELDKNDFKIDLNKVKEDKEIFKLGYEITNNSIADVKDANFLSLKLIEINSTKESFKLGFTENQQKSNVDIKNRIKTIRENSLNTNKNKNNFTI